MISMGATSSLMALEALERDDISLISNNCVGGAIIKDLKIRHNSPTVSSFMFAPDYIRFVEHLDRFLAIDIQPAARSRYGIYTYPIGLLEDIEVHFFHDIDFNQAKAAWNRRRERVKGNRLFILGSDRDHCGPNIVRRFDALPYPNKLFLSSKPYPELKSVLYFPEHANKEQVPDLIPGREWNRHIDIVAWLNRGV